MQTRRASADSARVRAQAEVAEAAAAAAHKAAAAAAADVAGLAAQLAHAPPAADAPQPAPPGDGGGAAADGGNGASADALAQAHMRAALAEQRSAVAELKTRLDSNAAYFQARAAPIRAALRPGPNPNPDRLPAHSPAAQTACWLSSAAPRQSRGAPPARMPAMRFTPDRGPAVRRASGCVSRASRRAGRAGRAHAAQAAGAQAPRLGAQEVQDGLAEVGQQVAAAVGTYAEAQADGRAQLLALAERVNALQARAVPLRRRGSGSQCLLAAYCGVVCGGRPCGLAWCSVTAGGGRRSQSAD
jgi:hypothetical protein